MPQVTLLIAAVAFIVFATTRLRMHPFLALLLAAYGIGLASGLPAEETVKALTGGFGTTLAAIGVVIACGSIIGTVLERSGCAVVMASSVLRLIGTTRSILAVALTGAAVSVPVFCDSGYVVLSPLSRSLARQTAQSLAPFAVALSLGLYTTHVFVPPTPGPIAAAGELRADLGMVILLGLVVSVPVLLAITAFARRAGARVPLDPGAPTEPIETAAAAPSPLAVFAPIAVPVLLIAGRSVAELASLPLGDGILRAAFRFAGNPNTALLIGVGLVWWTARRHGLKAFGAWTGEALQTAGVILLITGAGGALGGVLRQTPLMAYLSSAMAGLDWGFFSLALLFGVAASLKTALGSSTVAIITTASLFSPLLPSFGLDLGQGPALATLAIGAGSMVVSHVNDSYFWVVTQFSGMTVAQGFRLITAGSAIAGFTGLAAVLLLAAALL